MWQQLLLWTRWMCGKLQCCRAMHADLPIGSAVLLNTQAPSGNIAIEFSFCQRHVRSCRPGRCIANQHLLSDTTNAMAPHLHSGPAVMTNAQACAAAAWKCCPLPSLSAAVSRSHGATIYRFTSARTPLSTRPELSSPASTRGRGLYITVACTCDTACLQLPTGAHASADGSCEACCGYSS